MAKLDAYAIYAVTELVTRALPPDEIAFKPIALTVEFAESGSKLFITSVITVPTVTPTPAMVLSALINLPTLAS